MKIDLFHQHSIYKMFQSISSYFRVELDCISAVGRTYQVHEKSLYGGNGTYEGKSKKSSRGSTISAKATYD